MDTLHLACATDANYAPHAAAMLASVMAQGDPRRWQFHVLHGPQLDAVSIARLRAPIEARGPAIRFHCIDDTRVAGLPRMDRIGSEMWYRIFLPELLPDAARVLYVDCDVLAADDLAPLIGSDLHGAALGAVRNVFDRGMEQRAFALGLASPRDYFNSGVLLFDLDAWRREALAARVLAIARARAAELLWPDQDALNLALAGRWHALAPRWNAMNSLYYFDLLGGAFSAAEQAAAVQSPGIVHFEGPGFCKPWHYLCKHPQREAYLRHRAATAWPTVQLDGGTPRNRLLRLLPMRQIPRALALIERIERGLRRRLQRLTGTPRQAPGQP